MDSKTHDYEGQQNIKISWKAGQQRRVKYSAIRLSIQLQLSQTARHLAIPDSKIFSYPGQQDIQRSKRAKDSKTFSHPGQQKLVKIQLSRKAKDSKIQLLVYPFSKTFSQIARYLAIQDSKGQQNIKLSLPGEVIFSFPGQ